LREHIRAHHSGPDLKNASSGGAFACKVCGTTLATSEDLCLHLVKHSDENTARHRKPNLAPRKYKRRRRLKPHEVDSADDGLDNDSETESDSTHKRKMMRPKGRPDYESMVRSFDAAVDTMNTMVGQVRSDHEKAKLKKKKKLKRRMLLAEAATQDRFGDEHAAYPGPSGLSAEGSDFPVDAKSSSLNRIRPRIKNVSMAQRTPVRLAKATKNAPPASAAAAAPEEAAEPGDADLKMRKGPRTKNVNYHHEKKKMPSAKFPKEGRDRESRDMRKIKGRKPIRKPKFLTQNGNLKKDLLMGRKGSIPTAASSAAPSASTSDAAGDPSTSATPPASSATSLQPIMQVVVKEEIREEFKCEICGEIFYTRPELLFHVSIHI